MRNAEDSELSPEYRERLFDPPCLGIPSGPSLSGRAQCPGGGFVAVYLALCEGRVQEAGFLTDCPHPALLVASLWCERVQGLTGIEAAALDILRLEPELAGVNGSREAARACRQAARAALESAGGASCRGRSNQPCLVARPGAPAGLNDRR